MKAHLCLTAFTATIIITCSGSFAQGDLAGGGADADSDGSSDSAEYHADTDPTDLTSYLTVSSQEVGLASGNSVNLAWLSEQGISYSVMVSDDLVNWTALNGQPIAGTGGELSKEFIFDGPSCWLRVSAWRSSPQ